MKKGKHSKNKTNKPLRIILIVVFILCISYLVYYFYSAYKEKKEYSQILDNIVIDETKVNDVKTKRMLQLEELNKQNEEIIGWLEIEGTNINYPVLQGKDNDYYLTHNYKKEKASLGSIFLDKDFDLANGGSNYLIYGHRSKNGLMFEQLMKYSKENFYKEHPKIKFTTLKEDAEYEIISVFYSRVYKKSEQDVFRYYYFVDAKTEKEFNNFVENAKKASIYNIDATAKYGDQLLTLSTCEYSQNNGRFAIVAKKVDNVQKK